MGEIEKLATYLRQAWIVSSVEWFTPWANLCFEGKQSVRSQIVAFIDAALIIVIIIWLFIPESYVSVLFYVQGCA